MKQLPFFRYKTIAVFSIALFGFFAGNAQSVLDDLISKSEAVAANESYGNYVKSIKPDGQTSANKATKNVILQVDKLKEIVDACKAHGVDQVSAMFVWITDSNAKFARGSTANSRAAIGYQSLVFRVPAIAFPGQTGAKINSPKNPLMLSLLGAGLVLLDPAETGLPFAGDLYFAIGGICPPPESCD